MKNKKIIAVLIILCIMISFSGCDKIETDIVNNESEIEIVKDDFDNLKITEISGLNYGYCTDLENMYESSDYVVVGTPVDIFADSKQVWIDTSAKNTENFEAAHAVYSYTERDFKINKVYKGKDLNLKKITVCENIIANDEEMKLLSGEYPMTKGEKYLLFLYESNTEDLYFAYLTQGKHEVNTSDDRLDKSIDKDMLKQVKERFKEEFKYK